LFFSLTTNLPIKIDVSFDLDLPLEVDDEYWEGRQDSEKVFEQPRNIPSRIAAFNHFIKLTQIMAFTMRTMVCVIGLCQNYISLFQSTLLTNRKISAE
jgi:hypothetical protein